MVVISHAYTAAWDQRVKDDSFAARVNQTILKAALRNEITGGPTAENARRDASGHQGEALLSLPLPAPRWEQPPSPAAAQLNGACEISSALGSHATCQPDVSREPSGNEAEIQLPVSRFEGLQASTGQGRSNPPLTMRAINRPHTARPSSKGSKPGGSTGVMAARAGHLTDRVHVMDRTAGARPERTPSSKVVNKKEAWGERQGGAQSLSIKGSTPRGMQGVSRPVSGSLGRSKLTLDLTSVRVTAGSATPTYRTFRMPRSPAVRAAANVRTPPGKAALQQTASVQILCLETPRPDAEPVSSPPVGPGGSEPSSEAAVEAAPGTESAAVRQEAAPPAFKEEVPTEVLAARARLEKVQEDVVKYPLMARVRKSRKPAGKQPSQPGAQMIPARNSAGQIVGEVEIPADIVNGENRAAAVPMVLDRNAWKGARLTGPEEEKARQEMRRASLQLWRNANGGYVVPSKPIVSDYRDQMRWRPEEQDQLDDTYHSHKSAFKELIEMELLYRQRIALAKRDM